MQRLISIRDKQGTKVANIQCRKKTIFNKTMIYEPENIEANTIWLGYDKQSQTT